MVLNQLLTSFRGLKKNGFFSILNILGLSIGMTVFLLIALYVKFEQSYEDFVPAAANIYRVKLEQFVNNESVLHTAENYPGVGPALKNELPQVIAYARLYNMGYKNNVIITYEDSRPEPIAFKQRRFLYADSAFLSMMGYELVEGESRTALASPNTAVISERYARMYFGKEDPVGKMLHMKDDDFNDELVKVTGVFKELPANTHLKFDILFSYKTLYGRRPERGNWAVGRYDQSWERNDMYTFIQLQPGADPRRIESAIPALVEKYSPGLKEKNQKMVLMLQPLRDIHLKSNLADEPEPNGDERIVKFLGIIGVFVLIIAWINYVNLSTAKAMDRAREVGMRKVMGALSRHLVRQFLLEAALINIFAMVIAFVLVILFLPSFNSISGLTLDVSSVMEGWFVMLMALSTLIGTLISGSYPAIVLSSYKPVTALKGKIKNSVQGVVLRRSLVVVQFMASMALIAGTIIVFQQLDYMMSSDLGVNIDQVMVIERPGIAPRDRKLFNSAIEVFRNEVKKEKDVQNVSTSITIPGKQREYRVMAKKYGASDDQQVSLLANSMDDEFMEVFKMKLLAGRKFIVTNQHDQDTSVIISESASRLLGFSKPEDAIGQTVTLDFGQAWHPVIVGVVNDYHSASLKKSLAPLLFYCTQYEGEFYSIRIETTNVKNSVDHIQTAWQKAFPGNPFEYFFLDDYFNHQYENERKFGKLFTTFSGLAIIVGCLGLFGLSAYTATQRTKEIGVRKVLGSSVNGIFMLLSKEYVKLVGLSILLAVPVVYFAMDNWIKSFPYHINISFLIFVGSGLIVLLIALLTVSFQTFKAARVNPIDSLRCE